MGNHALMEVTVVLETIAETIFKVVMFFTIIWGIAITLVVCLGHSDDHYDKKPTDDP